MFFLSANAAAKVGFLYNLAAGTYMLHIPTAMIINE